MTKKKIDPRLTKAWNQRLKLYAKGYKLRAKGHKLFAKGYKLFAEGYKLLAEGDKLWAEAILRVHGNITLKWKAGSCTLSTGEVFHP